VTNEMIIFIMTLGTPLQEIYQERKNYWGRNQTSVKTCTRTLWVCNSVRNMSESFLWLN